MKGKEFKKEKKNSKNEKVRRKQKENKWKWSKKKVNNEKLESTLKKKLVFEIFTFPEVFSFLTSTLDRNQPAANPESSWPIRIFSISSPISSNFKKREKGILCLWYK